MDTLKKIFQWLTAISPASLRATILFLVGLLVFLFTLTSCGQTVRVTVKDTPNGVSISTTQNKADSSSTSIKINPTINFTK